MAMLEDVRITSPFDEQVAETERWFQSSRFQGTTRLYTARQVVEQRGRIADGKVEEFQVTLKVGFKIER